MSQADQLYSKWLCEPVAEFSTDATCGRLQAKGLLLFVQQSIISLLSTWSLHWCLMLKAEPLCFHCGEGEQISPTSLFHVKISIYMNITQSEWDAVKVCVCMCRFEAVSNFSQTRRERSRADHSFPLPRYFHWGLHANKIKVLIKGFKQLAYFH